MRKATIPRVIIIAAVTLFISLSFQKVNGQKLLKKIKDAAAKEVYKQTHSKPDAGTPTVNDQKKSPDTLAAVRNNSNKINSTNAAATSPVSLVPKEIHLIPMPTSGVYDFGKLTVCNNKLYFGYKKGSGNEDLAECDGTNIKNISIPDSLNGVFNEHFQEGLDLQFVVYKNTLYIPTRAHQIIIYDGISIKPVKKDNAQDEFHNPFLCNNYLYFQVTHVNRNERSTDYYEMAQYDGRNITYIPIPRGLGIMHQTQGFPILFNNKTYLLGRSNMGLEAIQLDGKKLIPLKEVANQNDQNYASLTVNPFINPFIYKNILYFSCSSFIKSTGQRSNEHGQLVGFDGNSINMVPNPDRYEFNASGESFTFNNKLYLNIKSSYGYQENKFLEFDGKSIKHIPEINMKGKAIVYENKLYFTQENSEVIQYDGVNYTKLVDIHEFINPIIYNNKLYFFDHHILKCYNGKEVKEVCDLSGLFQSTEESIYAPVMCNNRLYFICGYRNQQVANGPRQQQLVYLEEENK